MKRKGFTLIELVVAMVIFFILIYMAFAAFTYILAFSQYNKQREDVQENMSTVMDQITKELRQTVTDPNNGIDPAEKYGIEFPAYDANSDSIRNLKTISNPDEPLNPSVYLQFHKADTDGNDDPGHPILRFYIVDNNGNKHQISYTLGVPTDGSGYSPPHYKGTPRRYWPSKEYEPCEILYSNETWTDSNGDGIAQDDEWSGIQNQPVTEQVITDFTVIRPAWSDKVVQIVIEAMIKSPTRKGYEKIRYIGQITLRQ